MSLILAHDQRQLQAAEESAASLAERYGKPVRTRIELLEQFTWAEDYHQKYYLKNLRILTLELSAVYPRHEDLVNSRAAARLNGYAGGYGSATRLSRELDLYGLTEPAAHALLSMASRRIM
jgi:peptide-methionine (S)-S-oxide reductase